MADEDAQGAPPATPDPPPAKEDVALAAAGEKALEAFKQRARDAEAKVKELAPLADRARELEEAQQSEVEKAKGKLDKAEQARAQAEAKLLRYEVAQEKEVPAKLVPLLTANDKDGLEAQADLIIENVKAGETPPDFDGGAREPAAPSTTPEEEHNQFLLKAFGAKPQ